MNSKPLTIKLYVTIAIIGLLLSLWLSGTIYLYFAHLDYHNATPLTVFRYGYFYGHDKPTQFWLGLSLLLGFVPIGLPLILKFKPKKPPLYGEAKFASQQKIKQAGLLGQTGIIVGKQQGLLQKQYLQFSGQQHVLMSAPTRSGKGVGVVVPNLLSWQDSIVVLDIKQENWNISAGFRKAHGQQCFLLNLAPRDYQSHRWNPLHYISSDPSFRINDIQKIGQMLFPNIDNESPIWQASARSLWLGLVLFLLETPPLPVTMGEVLRQLNKGDTYLIALINERMQSPQPLSGQCHSSLKDYLETPERTRGSIRKSFTSALELFYNPVIDAVTAHNDFDLRQLRTQKLSIYVGVTPDDLQRLAPLINLFFQQLIDLNTRELPEQNPNLKHQVLLLMDEFAAIGKVNILSKGISYVAGYGLRLLTIIQSPSQLREIYGHDGAETLIENHALQIVFAPKNPKVAREISDILGTNTIKQRSHGRQLTGKGGRSENTSDHSRALMLPQEIMRLGQQQALLLLEHCPPVKCCKIRWYQDKAFKLRGNGREQQQSPAPSIPKVSVKNSIAVASTPIKLVSDDAGETATPQPSTQPKPQTKAQQQPKSKPAEKPVNQNAIDESQIDAYVDDYLKTLPVENTE
ncbi:type IV secretory system conjugative DNA transfer family protein [Shewanella sp. 202IG2-18]|uniref:type IV secretory system conjugative DNA transfer family protein n=1 Tax=Parashewanella hymeniacidonis TaxID=2807618 RepID=UPI0019607393|nr:type IV secretory system conjugative DNA transfer family protein [Parashewanella hymeniacidonis]MBM7073964.1 type IV secretory system conjugative DNA transfer family protein [Parashewanella hymeniacidonis]